MIGRLTTRNPAYVMPSLRKTLIQLLTELGKNTHAHPYHATSLLIFYFFFSSSFSFLSRAEFSGDSRSKEESAKLLCNLIRSSERLIKPYVEPILKALLLKLRDPNPRVASYVLAALGELAIVGGEGILSDLVLREVKVRRRGGREKSYYF